MQAKGLDGTAQPATSIETMADNYLEALLEIQPDGPYLIAGYCFGGWVAVEVARRLRWRGADIAGLFLIDPDLPANARAPKQPPGRAWELARRVITGQPGHLWLSARCRLHRAADQARMPLPGPATEQRHSRAWELARRLAVGRPESPSYLWLAGRVIMDRTRMRLLRLGAGRLDQNSWLHRHLLSYPDYVISAMTAHYQPNSYDGPAVVLVPGDKLLTSAERQAWARFIRGGIEFEQLAGTTRDLLRQPYVRDLTACLLARMACD